MALGLLDQLVGKPDCQPAAGSLLIMTFLNDRSGQRLLPIRIDTTAAVLTTTLMLLLLNFVPILIRLVE